MVVRPRWYIDSSLKLLDKGIFPNVELVSIALVLYYLGMSS